MTRLFLLVLLFSISTLAQSLKPSQLTVLPQSQLASGDLSFFMDLSASATKTVTFGDLDQRWKETATLPLSRSAGSVFSISQSSASADGYLSSTDWTTFNNKVSLTGSQILTNKTIDADSNTLSNIDNNEIKAAAGIAYSKLNLNNSIVSSDLSGAVPLLKGGTGQTTKAAAFDALSPMTSSGDIIYGGASGTGTRLAKGSDGQALVLASGLPSWAAVMTNPMTTGGDIVYGGASGVATRLANGSAGQFLRSAGGTSAPTWSSTLVSPTSSGDLTLSNGGIVFPAAQVASANANTLDDYEEGSWTPIYDGTGTQGTWGYAVQNGRYIKIGKKVTVWWQLDASSRSVAPTGDVHISGLPFASAATIIYGGNVSYFGGLGGNAIWIGAMTSGGSEIDVVYTATATTVVTYLSPTLAGTDIYLIGSVTYEATN